MRCPICKREVPDAKADEPLPPHYPFCSDRCKLIDLNRWLTGRYQIPIVDPRGDDPPPFTPPDDN